MDVVLLGFIDQPVSDPSAVLWDTNKIGGSPVRTCSSPHIGWYVALMLLLCIYLFAYWYIYIYELQLFGGYFFVNNFTISYLMLSQLTSSPLPAMSRQLVFGSLFIKILFYLPNVTTRFRDW